jgi:hypothetical protein
MKLTKHQIELIDESLISNDVIYVDVKYELMDHIASEIEHEIENNNSNFEDAFAIIFEKWKELLQSSSNPTWLGILLHGPKVVVDIWVSYTKKQLLYSLIYGLLFSTALTSFLHFYHQKNIISIVNDSIKVLCSLILIATIVGFILIKQSKIKTAYGHMSKRRSFFAVVPFYFFGLNQRNYFYLYDFGNSWATNFIGIFLILFLLLIPYLNLKLVLEHFKTIRKYNLI